MQVRLLLIGKMEVYFVQTKSGVWDADVMVGLGSCPVLQMLQYYVEITRYSDCGGAVGPS